MDISIIISILIAWAIIKLLEAMWAYKKRKGLITSHESTRLIFDDDAAVKMQFQSPSGEDYDARLEVLWPIMTEVERRKWHTVVRANAEDARRVEQQQDDANKLDRSTDYGQAAYEMHYKNRDQMFKTMENRVDRLVLIIRERLDDEVRVARHLSNKALIKHNEATANGNWITRIKLQSYLKRKKERIKDVSLKQ